MTAKQKRTEQHTAEAKLRRLGQRLRQGWTALHPATREELDQVRNAVRLQWEQEQARRGQTRTKETATKIRATRQAGPARSRPKSQSQDHGHGH